MQLKFNFKVNLILLHVLLDLIDNRILLGIQILNHTFSNLKYLIIIAGNQKSLHWTKYFNILGLGLEPYNYIRGFMILLLTNTSVCMAVLI